MSSTKRNTQLKEVFKYSDADLLLNQQDQVSEDQKLTLKTYRQGRVLALIAFGVMFVLLASVFAWVGTWMLAHPGGDVRRLAILGAMGVVALLIGLSSVNYFLRSRHILTGKVSQVQGAAKVYMREYRGEYTGTLTGWYIKIGRKEFQLTTAEQHAALEDGTVYRIFYIKGYPLDMLLSIEAI